MIVALAGRRIDAPGAGPERFPLAEVESVKRKIIELFASVDAKQVVCSGACGADLLALQAADELEIPQTMILPFNAGSFRSTSVTDRPGEWGSIFDKLVTKLKGTDRLIELNYHQKDDNAYLETNFRILDQAQQIAGISTAAGTKSNVIAVIVWEGKPKDADDTTYHFKKEAEKRNLIIKEIISIKK